MENNKYDVFLSRKSEDAHMAKEVYDFLTEKGLKVFDSDHSLQEMGNADYSKAIDEALVNTLHMIVVGSSLENITSSWVEAEWRFFLNRIRANKTEGNLFSVISKDLSIDDLPPSLQNFEIIQHDPIWFDKIFLYVKPNSRYQSELNKIQIESDLNLTSEEIEVLFGEGVIQMNEEKYDQALKVFFKLSKINHVKSLNNLGVLYEKGLGVDQNYYEAAKWYTIAANLNDSRSQNNLGVLYLNGLGVVQSFSQAFSLFERCRIAGEERGINNLGLMYYNGQYVEKDLLMAESLFLESARMGFCEAEYNLGVIYRNGGIGINIDYTRSFEYFKSSSEKGYPPSQFNLGVLFHEGYGVEQSYDYAYKWYRKAAEQDHSDAQYNLGILYAEGLGVLEDLEEAVKWFKKSALSGNLYGQFNLGIMYAYGEGVQLNDKKAIFWLTKAANAGLQEAIHALKELKFDT